MITKWGTPLVLVAISVLISAQNVCSQDKQGQTKNFTQAIQKKSETKNNLNPSSPKNEAYLQVPAQGTADIEVSEKLVSQWNNILNETRQEANATDKDFNLFIRFNQNYVDSERCALFQLVKSGKINESNITPYISAKKQKLQTLYSRFLEIKKEFPTSVAQNAVNAPITLDTCFPSCTNIDFSSGNFTGWSGFYAVNNSVTNYNITNITGGLLGPVVKGALDPFTGNTYQVHITSKANVDWFLKTFHGINMSQASP